MKKIKEEQFPYTQAVCEECDWKGVPADCETIWEQESYETPEYEVAICPKCNEENVMFYNEEQKNEKNN